MRALLATAAACAIVALPASVSAAAVDPKALVLTPAEVPVGFRFDRRASYVVSNARFGDPGLVARSGRVTGYRAEYQGHIGGRLRRITSRIEVFRRRAGARMIVLNTDALERRHNPGARAFEYGREPLGIGDEGWVYWNVSAGPGARRSVAVFAHWHHGRIAGSVYSWGVGRERTLTLARVQQRRIAAALG